MGVINPAADHVEKVYGDREVKALFPTADKKPETESAAREVRENVSLGTVTLD